MAQQPFWKAAGLIYGPAPHYIDHLAPLCSIMDIPLFVSEDEEKRLVRSFYPEVQVHKIDALSLPQFFIENIDIVFLCTPRVLFDEIFFFVQKLHGKRIHTIWCPHGNSDKGHRSLFMEGLSEEQVVLVYGDKMIDFLKQKKVFDQLQKHVITGNFRKAYYLHHKVFYDQLIQDKIVKKMPPAEKTVLYAPTWQDKESSSSFQGALSFLIEKLPSNWNLIIKPHPNLLMENETTNQKLIENYQGKDRVFFLMDFPPIFPLLAISDIYIGDFSSIGYDFLEFNRPMFFLNHKQRDPKLDPGLYLYQCGVEIRPEEYESIYTIIQKEIPKDRSIFEEIRIKTTNYTFHPRKSLESLKEEIEKSYTCFPDRDLNFF